MAVIWRNLGLSDYEQVLAQMRSFIAEACADTREEIWQRHIYIRQGTT